MTSLATAVFAIRLMVCILNIVHGKLCVRAQRFLLMVVLDGMDS